MSEMEDASLYEDVENEKEDGSASSVADFSASEDEWTPEKVEPTKATESVRGKSKVKAKASKKPVEPPRPARVSRRIAAKNGITLPEESNEELVVQQQSTIAVSSSEDETDSESEKKPPKKGKRKPARSNGPAKRMRRKNEASDDEPIKLTTFTVEQLYRKYRPDLAHPLPPAEKSGPSKPVDGGSKQAKKKSLNGEESDSSGDDYLVNPSELDLDSEFFRPTEQEKEQRKAVDLFFDCNAGVELTDSEDEADPAEAVDAGPSAGESRLAADVEVGKKLIQQINQSSEAYVQMVRLAEAATSSIIAGRAKSEATAKESKGKQQPSTEDGAQEDIGRLLVAGEKRGGKSLTTGFGRQDFVAVAPAKSSKEAERPKEIEITLKLGPETVGKDGRPQKRTFDVLTALKRFMNREKRTNQINMHKASLLCWIGHGTYVNNELRKPSLIQFARKKLLPGVMGQTSKSSRPDGLTNLRYFQELTRYYRRTIMLKDDTMFYRQRRHPKLGKFLIFAIGKKAAYCKRDYILLFVLMLRTLGVHCRLVISPAVPPKHIPSDQLYKMNPRTAKEVAMERQLLQEFRRAPRESMVYAAKEKLLALVMKQKDQRSSSRGKRKPSGFTVPQLDGGSDELPQAPKEKKLKPMVGSFLKMQTNRPASGVKSTTTAEKQLDIDEEVRKRRERILAAYQARAASFGRSKKKSTNAEEAKKKGPTAKGVDYWVEVFCEHEDKWITIDVLNGVVYKLEDIVKQATQPIVYVLAWNNDGSIKDVSPRYISRIGSKKSKLRVEDEWLERALRPYRGKRTKRDIIEDIKFDRLLNKRPFPEQISEYKNHPRYAIERYLLRNEAIYPPDAPIVGRIREEPIFLRDCVHTLHSRESWLRQAKTVRMHEQPYKVVKAKAKYDRFTGTAITGQTMELFGSWQVQDYEPPVAKDGLVPRSAYGNVDLFQPCMLPKGTVHLQLPGLNRICRRLRVDCAQAITGFEYRNGACQAVYDGYVVCEEFRDQVLDEWYQEQVELDRKDDERRRKRIYGNWKRLIMGLCIRKKLKDRYNFDNM